jgi:PAS domain S-box-containing protein
VIVVSAIDEMTELRGVSDKQSDARKRNLLTISLVLGFAFWISALILRVNKNNLAMKLESEKSSALLHNSSDGIHILDTNGNVIEASESFCAMLGYRHEEIIGMNVSKWDAGFSDSAKLLAEVSKQFENPARSQFETRHKRKDGTIFDVEISGRPLVLNGKPALFNSSRDITERKQAVDALQRSKDIFQAIQLSITESIFLLDITGVILAVNPTAAERLGKSPNEVMGQDVFSFFPPEVAGPRRTVAKEMFRTLKPKTIEDVRNGRVFSSTYYPVINAQAQCEAVVVVGTEITERKQKELELRKFKDIVDACA